MNTDRHDPAPDPATDPAPAADDPVTRALGVIECQAAVLVRHFELLNRRGPASELDRAEYLLLRTLAGRGPTDVGTLAAALGVDPSTAGRQISTMRAAALLTAEPDPSDRRRTVISPTPEGLRRMEAVREARAASFADLLADWDVADLRTLGEMFARYNRAVADRYLTAGPSDGGTADGGAPAGAGRG